MGPKVFIITSIVALSVFKDFGKAATIPEDQNQTVAVDLGSDIVEPENDTSVEPSDRQGNGMSPRIPIDVRIFIGYDNEWSNAFPIIPVETIKVLIMEAQEIFRWDSLGRSFILKIVQIKKYNRNFRSSQLDLVKPLAKAAPVDADVYLFMSMHDPKSSDSYGKAQGVGGVCLKRDDRSFRVAIAEYTTNFETTVKVIVHEIAHVLGFKHDDHDGRTGCTQSLMHRNAMPSTWSECNRQDFSEYVNHVTRKGDDFCMGSFGGECNRSPYFYSYQSGKRCCTSKPSGGFYSTNCQGGSRTCVNPPCRDRRGYFKECTADYPYAAYKGEYCCEKQVKKMDCTFGCNLIDTGFYSSSCSKKISCSKKPCRNRMGYSYEFYSAYNFSAWLG